MSSNPCGLFIQGQGMGDGEMNATVEHIAAANYSTVSVMDNFGLCSRIKDRVPTCDVIYRSFGFEPQPSGDNRKVIQEYFKITPQDKRIRLMVNCENGFTKDRVQMSIDHIRAANDAGWKLCVGNTGSGTIRSGQLKGDGTHEVNEWLTIGAPLLKVLAENPEQGIGYHNYTSVFVWVVSNGTYTFQKHDQPPVIDMNLAQWHMGRDMQGINAACDELGIQTPLQFVTESWVDEMNDIQQNPSNPYHAFVSNRWRKLIEPWKTLYPGRDAEDILADQFIWIWENVFAKYGRGRVRGMHFFTWLSTALSQGMWAGDDVANAMTYRGRMEKYRYTGQTPPVPPPTPPPTPPPVKTPSLSDLKALRARLNTRDIQIEQILHNLGIIELDSQADIATLDAWIKAHGE
jgi:hypothetical protein